ncbi:MAG TPA: hypothetical protein VFX85_02340 [Solirubrobacterales bacterium]|nr:hypothetical protein [Solirubrobacterales bacterium]
MLVTAAAALAAETYGPDGSFSGPGTGPGQVTDPERAAVEQSTGNLFVVDRGNGQIDVFKPNGDYLTSFGEAQLDSPFGIAIREDAGQTSVYVSDAAFGKVRRFASDEAATPSFTFDAAYPGPAAGSGPAAVGDFAAPLALAPNGDLWVADTGDDKLQRYSPTGAFVSSIDGTGAPSGVFASLIDLAVDSAGRVYAIDSRPGENQIGETNTLIENQPDGTWAGGLSRVERFAADGTHQLTLPGLFRPAAVAVNPATDEVAVAADQTAVDSNLAPSLRVFSSSGAELYFNRMGAVYTTVHGLAFESATPRIWSVNDSGYWNGAPNGQEGVHRFALNITLPEPSVDPVTDAEFTKATFSGEVDPKGSTAMARFEVSKDGGANWETAPNSGDIPVCEVTAPGDCESSVPVELNATGLTPGTSYLVRLRGMIASGAGSASATQSFSTNPVAKPVVTFDPVSAITSSSAHFAGTFNPNAPGAAPQDPAFDTTWRFECSPACPNNPGSQTVPADNQTIPVEFDPKGLEAGVEYEVSLIAENAGGATVQTRNFSTVAVAPTATTHITGGVTQSQARLSGFVDPQNRTATYYFQWGLQPNLSDASSVPAAQNGVVDSFTEPYLVVEDVGGLQPDTAYYFRLVAKSAVGTSNGQIERFVTKPAPPAIGKGVGAFGDRGLEMVSEAEKNGNPVNYLANYSRDGERVLYYVTGGTATTTVGDRFGSALIAERTPDGWVSRSALPARTGLPYQQLALRGITADLNHVMVEAGPEVSVGGIVQGDSEWIHFQPFTKTTERLGKWYVGTRQEKVEFRLASDKFEHAFGWGEFKKPGSSELEVGRVYDYAREDRELVSVLPEDEVPACGMPWPSDHLPPRIEPWAHVASTDGSRVFFKSLAADVPAEECFGPPQLYMREASPSGKFGPGTGATTTLISGPAATGELGEVQFIKASPDGSEVFYTSRTRVTPDDDNIFGLDLYRYRLGEGNECLTCVVPNAQISYYQDVVVSADGSRAYFASKETLTPGSMPPEGEDENLYWLDTETGEIEFIAQISAMRNIVDPLLHISEDGRSAVFMTPVRDQTDQVANVDAAGTQQIMHYDEETRALDCISCAANGASLSTIDFLLEDFPNGPRGFPLSADGRVVVFKTATALVPGDVNGDVDVYEWRDGVVGLLTDGKGSLGENYTHVTGVSPDGEDIFFISGDLLPESDGTTGQVYDARIGGGFKRIPPPVPCGGDGCQGAPTAPPAGVAAGSASFSGPSNRSVKTKPRCVKPKKGKRKVRCVKPKGKKKSGKRAANKNRRTSK